MVKAKVILVIAFMFLLLIPLVSAKVVAQSSADTIGLEIKYPQIDVKKQGQDFKFHTHVYNTSSGLLVTNVTTSCEIHIYNSSGSHVLESAMAWDSNNRDFKLDIAGTTFADSQMMSAIVTCNTSKVGGFVSFSFDVNPTGRELTQARSMLYIGLLSILVFMFIVNVAGITVLPSRDVRADDGEILSINHLKYLKPILYVTAYVILMAIFYISSNVALAYLGAELIGQFMFVTFKIMGYLLLPMVFIWLVYIILSIFKDKETRSMIERGVPVGSNDI